MNPLLDAVSEAAAQGDWRKAVALVRAEPGVLTLPELCERPQQAVAIAWTAFHGACGFNEELARLLAPAVQPHAKEAEFPTRLSDAVFEEGLGRWRLAIHMRNAEVVVDWGLALAMLVGATSTRESRLKAGLDELVTMLEAVQTQALQAIPEAERMSPRSSYRTRRFTGPRGPFALPARMYQALAQSDFYPELAARFLRQVLCIAQWPILQHMDTFLVLVAWGDLMDLVNDPAALGNLPPVPGMWLRKAVMLDPEPFAPGEFAEEDTP